MQRLWNAAGRIFSATSPCVKGMTSVVGPASHEERREGYALDYPAR